ncbi:MAG TPA: transcriptional repressor [Desulfobacter sp.]|nr:transcriptional repressor [Desulfobacter sp.]
MSSISKSSEMVQMSLATVYRNIVLIKSLSEILELGFPDGRNRYDGNKPYPHVILDFFWHLQ